METGAFIAELERLKVGAPHSESRVLSIISQSTLFLVAEGNPAGDDGRLTVKVRISSNQGHPSAYLFSSEELLQKWCEQLSISAFPMPINGADLSLALPKGTSIEIDPGTPHWVILTPEKIEMLNNPEAIAHYAPTAAAQQTRVESSEPSTLVETSNAVASPASEGASGDATQEPVRKKFFARGSPTTLFEPPAIDKKVDISSRPRTFTSSNLKKVVRSNKPGEGGG